MKKQEYIEAHFSYGDRKHKTLVGSNTKCNKVILVDGNKGVKPGEDWECKIISESNMAMIVKPVKLLVTAQENDMMLNQSIPLLVKKFSIM